MYFKSTLSASTLCLALTSIVLGTFVPQATLTQWMHVGAVDLNGIFMLSGVAVFVLYLVMSSSAQQKLDAHSGTSDSLIALNSATTNYPNHCGYGYQRDVAKDYNNDVKRFEP